MFSVYLLIVLSPGYLIRQNFSMSAKMSSPSDEIIHAQCDWKECSNPSEYTCQACGVACYCSKECQRKHWKCAVNPHKAMCKWEKIAARYTLPEKPGFWGLIVITYCGRNANVEVTKSSSDSKFVKCGKGSHCVVSKDDALTELALFYSALTFLFNQDPRVALEVDDVPVEVPPTANNMDGDAVEVYIRNRWGMKQLF